MNFAASQGGISPSFERAMRLLLTRPRDDAEPLAHSLKLRGHEPIIAPLMEIRFVPGPEIPLTGIQGLIATSANGIRALAARSKIRNLTVFAVGPQTAETAGLTGFTEVVCANGDSAALAATIIERANPANGPLLHAAGTDTAGRLSESLRQHGFRVETIVLYEAVSVERLPHEAGERLRQDTLDGVLLFSPRSAAIFVALTAKAGLSAQCERLTAFCISAATAKALSPLCFGRLAIAASSNQQSMLDLVGDSEASA